MLSCLGVSWSSFSSVNISSFKSGHFQIPASDTVILNDNLVFDSDDVKDEGVARPDFSMLGFALTLLSVFFLLVN